MCTWDDLCLGRFELKAICTRGTYKIGIASVCSPTRKVTLPNIGRRPTDYADSVHAHPFCLRTFGSVVCRPGITGLLWNLWVPMECHGRPWIPYYPRNAHVHVNDSKNLLSPCLTSIQQIRCLLQFLRAIFVIAPELILVPRVFIRASFILLSRGLWITCTHLCMHACLCLHACMWMDAHFESNKNYKQI